MTLIAALIDDDTMTLVSDILLTKGLRTGGLINKMPHWRGITMPQNIHVAGVVQKLYRFHDRSAILWSDRPPTAKRLIQELIVLFALNPFPTDAQIKQVTSKFMNEEVGFILAVSDPHNNLVAMSDDCSVQHWPDYGTIISGGSGDGDLTAFLSPNGEGEYGPESVQLPRKHPLGHKSLTLDLRLTALQVFDRDQYQNRWGGGVETALRDDDGRIGRVDNILYAFSRVFEHDGKIQVSPLDYMLAKKYVKDDLFLFEVDTAIGEARITKVPPLISRSPSSEEEARAIYPLDASYKIAAHAVMFDVDGKNRGNMAMWFSAAGVLQKVIKGLSQGDSTPLEDYRASIVARLKTSCFEFASKMV